MTEPNSPTNEDWAGERFITEFWASLNESNLCNELADKLPYYLGVIFIYFPTYLIKVFNPFSATRYTLTNRRLRVDKGVRKKTVQSVALVEIEDVRIARELSSTRTGDLEIIKQGEVVLRMVGIQDPQPSRRTILDAVNSLREVRKALQRQRQAKEDEARILAEQKASSDQ